MFEAPPARSRCRPGRCRRRRPCRVPVRRRGGERGARHRSYRSAARSPGGARGRSIRTRALSSGCSLHREVNLRRTPDSSERLERGNTAGPSTGHGASRRNYAAARLRYAAASAIALSKCAAVAGVALVRRGLRRTSSKYAAAVRLVKRRSPAWAGNGAVCTPATERGF